MVRRIVTWWGICGSWRFLGLVVGVAVAERDWKRGAYACVGSRDTSPRSSPTGILPTMLFPPI